MAPSRSLYIALLAGGRGTRFWPLSRRLRPKQLLDVTGEGPMLRRTWERVADLVPASRCLLVTSEDLAAASVRVLPLPRRNVLAEPVGRNTAPAVALALAAARERDPNAVVACLPSDHHVEHPARLRRILARAASEAARLQAPVLLGLPPREPSSEFGYLVPAAARGARGPLRVHQFAEKPTAARARRLIARGALWNSGMFVLPADATLRAMRVLHPRLVAAVESLPFGKGGRALQEALRRAWPRFEPLSFDSGILERLGEAKLAVHALEAAEIGWSDVGSWSALEEMLPADAAGNRSRGPSYFLHSRGCTTFQHDRSRTLVVLGGADLVLVDSGDVILAAPRSELGRLRELVARLERERPELT